MILGVAAFSQAASDFSVSVPGGAVDVQVRPGPPRGITDAEIHEWVEKAARAVAAYYVGFPVSVLHLHVRGGGSGTISGGRTFGRRGEATIDIAVGDTTTSRELRSNWVLVHEMVHLAFPSMTGHEWIEEGLSTYVEPIVRARAGLIAPDEIWSWLLWGAPRGLEGLGGAGLDDAHSWAATYWGGAVFCLLADVEIRQRTGNRKSLDDALRGIAKAGGNVTVSWTLERALEAGDRAVGVPVLTELHARMGHGTAHVDLDSLWKQLGVSSGKSGIVYDDAAPLAALRRGITTGR